MEVYLDNSATTKCFDQVCEAMQEMYKEEYGNPSSLHRKGISAENKMREAKEVVAKILKVDEKELIFTSGGTESDNHAIIGVAMAAKRRGMHLITTKIEHPAVLRTMEYLETQGFSVTYLSVDHTGHINMDELGQSITEETILVSIMHTNNEVGAVQDIKKIGALIKEKNPEALFHVDAIQGFGKYQIYPKRDKIDLLSISGHKIHGPKGIGLLYVGAKVRILPISYGGGQQRNLRSGTENVPGVVGFAKAAELCYENLSNKVEYLKSLKTRFINGLEELEDVVINSKQDDSFAPHIVSVSIKDIRSEVMLHALEDKGIYVSAGSACASNKTAVSDTLKAMNLEPWQFESTVRFSFSSFTTEEEIDYTLQQMCDMIPLLRRFTRK